MILASSSPQRSAILRQLGIPFTVIAPDIEERRSGPARALVLDNARRKASAVAAGQRASGDATTVLGVDTIVELDGRLYGKPADVAAARATLAALCGRTHRVLSGVCVICAGEERAATAATAVTFRKADPPTLEWYLESGEWQGRAGGYAIQGRGAALVQKIDGDYLNVVGLPVPTLLDLCPSALFPAVS